jgi:hypothetical protein
MAGNIRHGFLGDQDLVYGFDPKKVSDRLTTANWRRKAVMRQDRHGWLYVWVWVNKREMAGKIIAGYAVHVERLEEKGSQKYGCWFSTLGDALQYANGEDDSAFSRKTRALGKPIFNELGARLFGRKPAPVVVSVMGVGHKVDIPYPEEESRIEPDGYADFLTKVLESILAVSPGMSRYVFKHGIRLRPDVAGRKDFGPNSDLPERITVHCYKSERDVAARFRVFPKEPVGEGLIAAVRIIDPKRKPTIKGSRTEKGK